MGDVFALQIKRGPYLYGRVVRVDASVGPFKLCVLIYIYRACSRDKHSVPVLRVADLLLAPILTNQLPWKHGYFETVDRRPLEDADRLPQHCFREVRGLLFDEHSNRMATPVEPVGIWGVSSFQTIDDDVSAALGATPAAEASSGDRSVLHRSSCEV